MDNVTCYATLHKQVRDNEDEVSMTFKCSATEFDKVIAIPTQTLLKLTVELAAGANVTSPDNSH